MSEILFGILLGIILFAILAVVIFTAVLIWAHTRNPYPDSWKDL